MGTNTRKLHLLDQNIWEEYCFHIASQFSEKSKEYSLLPRSIRPNVAKSASSIITRTIVGESQGLFYKMLSEKRIQTLPDVCLYLPSSNLVLIRSFKLDMFAYESRFDFKNMTLGNTALLVAKFILDMLIAAHYLHAEGMICGVFEPINIVFDGLFWRLKSLSKTCTIEEAKIADKPKFDCPRDDLFGIAKSALLGFFDQLQLILWENDQVPLFSEFVKPNFFRMMYDDSVESAELLTSFLPSFNKMIDVFCNLKTSESVIATKILANRVIEEIMSKRLNSSN